jgi:hypothetical protein
MNVGELLTYLGLDTSHALSAPLTNWMTASPRFAAFVEAHRDKIRKKIRVEPEIEGLRDLLVELETAYLLLQERRFEVGYETYARQKSRGPDFAVTYRTNLVFNVEVTRLRSGATGREDRLIDVVCSKLGQMMPNMINVLSIFAEDSTSAALDVSAAMKRLKARAERGGAELFTRFGFRNTPDFFKHFTRLSAIVVRVKYGEISRPTALWENPQAKQLLPSAIRASLQRY